MGEDERVCPNSGRILSGCSREVARRQESRGSGTSSLDPIGRSERIDQALLGSQGIEKLKFQLPGVPSGRSKLSHQHFSVHSLDSLSLPLGDLSLDDLPVRLRPRSILVHKKLLSSLEISLLQVRPRIRLSPQTNNLVLAVRNDQFCLKEVLECLWVSLHALSTLVLVAEKCLFDGRVARRL